MLIANVHFIHRSTTTEWYCKVIHLAFRIECFGSVIESQKSGKNEVLFGS